MCRSTDYHDFISNNRFQDRLNIRGFFVRLSGLSAHPPPLPDSLTLLYLPRANGSPLDIDGSKIRPESKAFVTLHRVVSATRTKEGEVIFGCRERVRAGDGVGFEVYVAGQKAIKGNFRKDEGQEWKLECKCALESEMVGIEVAESEVCVAVDGPAVMTERVEMVVRRKRTGFVALETIPEERDEGESESNNCSCSCGDWEKLSDGGDSEDWCEVDVDADVDDVDLEMEMEGVNWAVDVGIWVMCLGVGYMVSKSSAKTLRRLRIL